MIDALITSKTRIKLLLKFFLNSNNNSYLRELAADFNDSTNSIRLELNRFEKAGLLTSKMLLNKKLYSANKDHPLFEDIHNILLKHVGFDQIIEKVIVKIGDLQKVFILGDLAKGKDSNIIDLLFVGKNIDKQYILSLINKAENLINKEIRFSIMEKKEAEHFVHNENLEQSHLLLWKSE